MKALLVFIVLALFFVPCIALENSAESTDFWYQLIPYGVSILAITVVFFAKKWFGLVFNKAQVERILLTITNLITNVEQTHKHLPGIEKQKRVKKIIIDGFPDGVMPIARKDKNFIERNFGSVDNVIEKAFQASHLASGASKLFGLIQKGIKKW